MKIIYSMLLLICISCSKDKRMERRLLKKDGKWDIKTLTNKSYLNDSLTNSITEDDYGYLVLKKNGNAVLWIDADGFDFGEVVNWSSTDESLFLQTSTTALRFKIDDISRKEMTLSNTQVYTDSTKATTTMKLERFN